MKPKPSKSPGLDSLTKQNQLLTLETEFEHVYRKAKKHYVYALLCLYQINQKKLYSLDYKSFREYLKKRWGYTGKSTVYIHFNYIEPYHTYLLAEQDELPEFDRLKKGYPLAIQGRAEEVYHSAKTADEEGFENNLREWGLNKLPATDTCEHNDTETITMIKCSKCMKVLQYEKRVNN